MARDPGLEEIVKGDLEAQRGITEKAMFGGLAWLLNGNLLCAARQGGMLVRLGKGNDGWVLKLPDATSMVMNGRQMPGWVRIGPKLYGDDRLRRKLIEAALTFVLSLPEK